MLSAILGHLVYLNQDYWRSHVTSTCDMANEIKYFMWTISSRGFLPAPFQDDCGVNTWEFCSRYSKDSQFVFKLLQMWSGENSEVHDHRSSTNECKRSEVWPWTTSAWIVMQPLAPATRNKQFYPNWSWRLTLNLAKIMQITVQL